MKGGNVKRGGGIVWEGKMSAGEYVRIPGLHIAIAIDLSGRQRRDSV